MLDALGKGHRSDAPLRDSMQDLDSSDLQSSRAWGDSWKKREKGAEEAGRARVPR